MRKSVIRIVGGISAAAAFATSAAAQGTPSAPILIPVPSGPQVGQAAPDFTLPGATRYGLLKNPVRLSDFRGSTVVLAFFYQARTKG
jgi:Peroxiredoxin